MAAHHNAEIIIAWVNGAHIQGQSPSTDEWIDIADVDKLGFGDRYLEPSPIHPDYAYWPNWRIKGTPDVFLVNYGKGGYKTVDRVLLDTLKFDTMRRAEEVAESLRELNYWTVIQKK